MSTAFLTSRHPRECFRLSIGLMVWACSTSSLLVEIKSPRTKVGTHVSPWKTSSRRRAEAESPSRNPRQTPVNRSSQDFSAFLSLAQRRSTWTWQSLPSSCCPLETPAVWSKRTPTFCENLTRKHWKWESTSSTMFSIPRLAFFLKFIRPGVQDSQRKFTGFSSAAHEEYDPVTKSYFNFNFIPGPSPEVHVFEISPSHPAGQTIGVIPTKRFSYLHSFSSTANYVILITWPLYYKWQGLKVLFDGNLSDSFEWVKEDPVLFHIMDRKAKKHVCTYALDAPFFCFHTY